ncbi:hypothetical protein [Streptomyces sp. DG1A-41]
MLLETGDLLVDPDRLAPHRFASWSHQKVRETAQAQYQGNHDAH